MKRIDLNINKISKGKGAILTLACFGGLMLLRSRLIPMFADDYAFSFIWDGKHHGNLAFGKQHYRRVRNAKDLLRSQISHYFSWSGRTVGETLNQLFLMFDDKRFFDYANSAVAMLQILLSDWIGCGRIRIKDIPDSLMKALTAGFFFGTPGLPHTALWQTGAMNYSWPGVLQSAFLLPYSLKTRKSDLRIPIPAALISGILAGWSNEAGGGTACLLSGLKLLRDIKRKEALSWEWCGFRSACAGFALLMLAPGNFNRLKIEKEYSDILPEDFSKEGSVPPEYVYKPEMFLHYLKGSFFTTVVRLMPLQIPVILCLLNGEKKEKADIERILALEAASFLVPSVLLLSPEFPKRAAYPSIIYALSAMSASWEFIDLDTLKKKYGKEMAVAEKLGIAYLGINIFSSVMVDKIWGSSIRNSAEIIRSGRGKDLVTIPQTYVPKFWSMLALDRAIDKESHEIGRFEADTEDPYNKAAAAYYGVGAVKAVSGNGDQ